MTVVDLFVLPKASEHTDVGFEIVWVRESESGISKKESSPLACSSLFFLKLPLECLGSFCRGALHIRNLFIYWLQKKII